MPTSKAKSPTTNPPKVKRTPARQRSGEGGSVEGSYGALVLALVLTKGQLGYAGKVLEVQFQAWSVTHEVDDFIVSGRDGGGDVTAYVASRLNAHLGADVKNVEFFGRFVNEYLNHATDMRNGACRLVLATDRGSEQTEHLSNFTIIARGTKEETFERAITKQDYTPNEVKSWNKLKLLYGKVSDNNSGAPSLWNFLRAFYVERHTWTTTSQDRADVQKRLDEFLEQYPYGGHLSVGEMNDLVRENMKKPGEYNYETLIRTLQERGLIKRLPSSNQTATKQTVKTPPASAASPRSSTLSAAITMQAPASKGVMSKDIATPSEVLKTPFATVLAKQQGLDVDDKEAANEIIRIDHEVRTFASWVKNLDGQERFLLVAFFNAAVADGGSWQLTASRVNLEAALNFHATCLPYEGHRASMIKSGGFVVDEDESIRVADEYSEGAYWLHEFIATNSDVKATARYLLSNGNWDIAFGSLAGKFDRHF